ncbi:hypothetical protein [Herbaspirillum sp. alder98]|uniref:hypothetical protein n=1 Tax=Herbaspirillum sp. alder98 TaxID=2913096 RepID=UPI001CD8E223|nr:hypothetical protein [Herbaspirillum sp. alder98]MCA1326681.1 hypothetical protein [Herbaspirillum sp. alder98]
MGLHKVFGLAGIASLVASLIIGSPAHAQAKPEVDSETVGAGKWVIEEIPLRGTDGSQVTATRSIPLAGMPSISCRHLMC